MLPDYGRYYGSVFSCLIEGSTEPLKIRRLDNGVQGFYFLNDTLPLYIKFCRNRRGPWGFNFRQEHQLQYARLIEKYGECVTALVCGKDGIVALQHSQIRQVLDEYFEEQETVSVRRKLKQMYSVTGSNGELSQKIGRNSLLTLVAGILGESLFFTAPVSDGLESDDEEGDLDLGSLPAQ